MSNVRINALTATAVTPNYDDYFVIDGNTYGTRNILATTALTATTGFGPLNINGNLTVTGITNEAAVTEVTLLSATPPLNNAIFNFDVCSQSVLYYTNNITGNFTLNVRGNSTTPLSNILATGQTTTLTLMLTTGTPSYYLSAFNIDNTVYYPKYQSGVTPANTYTNAINIYTYSITRTSPTPSYLVLGSFACFQ